MSFGSTVIGQQVLKFLGNQILNGLNEQKGAPKVDDGVPVTVRTKPFESQRNVEA